MIRVRICLVAAALLTMSAAAYAQMPDPQRLSFTLKAHETASGDGYQYEYKVTATYTLMTPVSPGMATSELESKVNAMADFLSLQPGERAAFYVSHIAGEHYSGFPEDDQVTRFSHATALSEEESQRVFGAVTLLRTATGAELHIGTLPEIITFGPDAQGAGCFGFGDGEIKPAVLTDKELRNWRTVKKSQTADCIMRDVEPPMRGRLTLDLDLAGQQEKATVAFEETCSGIAVGQAQKFTAKASPAGGKFRFWAEPAAALQVRPMGASATVTGSAPGKTTLHVEYVAPDGSTAQAARPLSCVRVKSINGNAPLQIGLYDAQGQPTRQVTSVPVDVEPGDGAIALDFRAANPALISIAPAVTSLDLQGVRAGTTTIQAVTTCGTPTGPELSVEIVPCTSDVVMELKEQERMLKARLQSNYRQRAEILGDDEFIRADKEGPKNIENLRNKLMDAAVTGYSLGRTKPPAGEPDDMKTVLDLYSAGKDAYKIVSAEDETARGKAMSDVASSRGMKAFAEKHGFKRYNDAYNAFKKLADAAAAAQKVAQDFGTAHGAAERLEELEEQEKKTLAELERVWSVLYKLCRAPGQPQPVEKTEIREPEKKEPQPPEPRKPPQQADKRQEPPRDVETGQTEPPKTEPPKTEPPKTEPPKTEPPKTTPTGRITLPVCGCEQATQKSSTIDFGSKKPFSSMLKAQGDCASDFAQSTEAFVQDIGEWQEAVLEIAESETADDAERQKVIEKNAPRIAAFPDMVDSYGLRGQQFAASVDHCANSFSVTISEIRLRY